MSATEVAPALRYSRIHRIGAWSGLNFATGPLT
jgi:hypothetical protein